MKKPYSLYPYLFSVALSIVCLFLQPVQSKAQLSCIQDDFNFVLDASGTNVKQSAGSNYVQHMDFELNVNFTFHAYDPVDLGDDIVQYTIEDVGTNFIFFSFEATDTTYSGQITNTIYENADISFSYTNLPFTGYVNYSTCTNEIELLFYPLAYFVPIFVDSPEPYAIEYSQVLNDTFRTQIAMHQPWCYLDDPYYYDVNGSTTIEMEPALKMYTQNRFLDEPKLLVTGLAGTSNPFGKICADGSEQTTLFKLNCTDENKVKILIAEDPDAMHPDRHGSLQESLSDCNTYYYTHPNNVLSNAGNPISYPFKTIHIQIIDIDTEAIIIELPIRIYRAPVVMIHGLWANKKSFENIDNNLTTNLNLWPDELTYRVDYKNTNANHFNTNQLVVFNAIDSMLSEACLNDYSVSRINLVGHSMGGLLSRLFIQSDDFENDICRFVTINTPHSGTQAANYLLSSQCLIARFDNAIVRRPISEGAVEDLQVCSPALWGESTGLNSVANLNNNIVPSHAIATTDYPSIDDPIAVGLLFLIETCQPKNAFDLLAEDVLTTYEHDLIVPKISQLGGLQGQATTQVYNQWHISLKNSEVVSKVAFLLNADPEGNHFWDEGFAPEKLTYNYVSDWNIPPEQGNITIESPQASSIYEPGTLLSISSSVTDNVSQQLLIANTIGEFPTFELQEQQNSTFSYQIPDDVVGPMKFTVLGFSDSNYVALDTVWINIESSAQVDSIWVEPGIINTLIGTGFSFTTYGLYDDGIIRNITAHPLVTFNIDDNDVAEIIEPGFLITKSSDTTYLHIFYENLNTTIPIIVKPGIIPPLSFDLLQKQNTSCNNSSDGAATVGAYGGISDYSYSWSNGGTGPTQLNLSAGTYTITATDFLGESVTLDVIIEEPVALNSSFQVTDESATNANDGSITISYNGGTAPYSFMWSNGDSTSTISNLTSGEYCITILDNNGCEFSDCIFVDNLCPTIITEIFETPVTCFGETDGTIIVTSTTATVPVSYLWSNGNSSSENNNLSAGTYTLTITGADGCSTTLSGEITQPQSLTIDLLSQVNITCAGEDSGAATINVSGGTPPYQYQWDDDNQQTTATAFGLLANTYAVIVIDSFSCEEELLITIQEPDPITIELDSIISETSNNQDGAIYISIEGGTGSDYTTQWFLNGALFSNNEDIINLSSGEYIVHISDSNGCIVQDTFLIEQLTKVFDLENSFSFSLFPNPAETGKNIFVKIVNINSSELTLTVSNILGKQLFSYRVIINSGESIISIPSPGEAGIYLISLHDKLGKGHSKKIIIN